MTNFIKGYKAFIIDNFRFLREVVIVSVTRDFYVIEYVDTGAVIRMRKSRLYGTRKEANEKLPPVRTNKGKPLGLLFESLNAKWGCRQKREVFVAAPLSSTSCYNIFVPFFIAIGRNLLKIFS